MAKHNYKKKKNNTNSSKRELLFKEPLQEYAEVVKNMGGSFKIKLISG